MSEWIDIENALPKEGKCVLVCDKFNDFVSMGKLIDKGDEFIFCLMNIDNVEIDSKVTQLTHWMPLPKPPGDG